MVPGLRIHGPRVRPVPGGASDHVAHLAEKFPFVPSARLHPPLLGKKGIAAHQVAQSDKFHEFPARNAAQIKPGADGRQPLDGNGGIPRTAGIHPGQGVRIFGTVNMDHIGTECVPGFSEEGLQLLSVGVHVGRGGNQIVGHGLSVQTPQPVPRIKHGRGQL